MTKHRPFSSNAESREQQLERLLMAMGISEDDPFTRFAWTQDLEHIESQYARWIAASNKQPDVDVDLVRRYRAAITKALMLSEKIGADFLANEIEKAGWARNIPDADQQTLHGLMADHGGASPESIGPHALW